MLFRKCCFENRRQVKKTVGKGKYDMHIGRSIKEELERQDKSVVWLARQLAYSRTNIYKIFAVILYKLNGIHRVRDRFFCYSKGELSGFFSVACSNFSFPGLCSCKDSPAYGSGISGINCKLNIWGCKFFFTGRINRLYCQRGSFPHLDCCRGRCYGNTLETVIYSKGKLSGFSVGSSCSNATFRFMVISPCVSRFPRLYFKSVLQA